MKLLMITPGYLCVPAINGGAVETLIDTIINENEKYDIMKINVISVNDGVNIDISKFKNTTYKFINNKKIGFKLKRIICSLINKIPNVYIGNAYINEVVKLIKDNNEDYDAVIVENNPLYVLKIKKYFNGPIYLHLHNDYLNNNSKLHDKAYSLYDKILTVSDYIGSRVKTINSNDKKTKTLYNGLDLDRFKKELSPVEKKLIREKYNFDKNDFVFLYTGRLIKQKGVKEMIIAFNNVCYNTHSKIKLLIVGSSSFKNGKKNRYMNELEHLVECNKENIKFAGYIDYDQIPKIYKACDAQIIPSIGNEALAMTAIEAICSELPVIATKIGGIPETTGVEGAIFVSKENIIKDIEEAILYIINNKEQSKKMVKKATTRVERFDKNKFYNNFFSLLNK